MKPRQKDNLELCRLLEQLIKENPDLRWQQILLSFGFVLPKQEVKGKALVDEFYVESEEILQRVKSKLSKS